MEIKEGMYVRTTMGIGKVEEIVYLNNNEEDKRYFLDRSSVYQFDDDDILAEPSFCISDVIKEGDLVTINSEHCKDEVYRVINTSDNIIQVDCLGDGYMCLNGVDIKEVLTKEQFADRAYKVKHD